MVSRRVRTAALAAPLAALLSCSSDDAGRSEVTSLRVGVPAPILRAAGQVAIGFHKGALTREGMVTIGNDGRPAPRILESWEVSADRLTWRLKVRPGVRFHDGTPATAAELAPHMSAQLKASSLGAVKSVEAEADHIVRVTLNEPYAFLFEDLALINAQRVSNGQTYYTGAYAVAEESPERLLLKAVPAHYRGEPAIDQVEITLYPDQRNAWSALMRDEIDMLYEVSRDSLDFVRSESSISVSTFTRPYVFLFGFNVAHPVLRDRRVRQALDVAVDRESLIRTGLAGDAEPAIGHVWPHHWAYDKAGTEGRYDPALSVRLLREAGLELQHVPGRMPARLRLKCSVYASMRKVALVLQRQLAAVDVDLQLEVVEFAEMVDRLTEGTFESFVFEMASMRFLKWPYQFWRSDSPMVKHGYSGADDVLAQLRRAATDDQVRAAAAAVQARFHEDPPAVFLAWPRISRAASRRFQVEGTAEDVYHTIARWKPAVKQGN